MSKERIDTKNCKECSHFEACCKWTDFPKQMMSIKPNCQKCYYGGTFIPGKSLASCSAPFAKEPCVTIFDDLIKREFVYVRRRNWDDECECGNFIPRLSEIDGDFELEPVTTFSTDFLCPFCDEIIYVDGIGIEETVLVTCGDCGREIAVKGKGI